VSSITFREKPPTITVRAGNESLERDYRIIHRVMTPKEVSNLTAVHPSEGGKIIKAGGVKFGLIRKHRTYREEFYKAVEESVLKEGFRNPVCCIGVDEGIYAYYGTTRLAVAHRAHINVPCLIADYTGRISGEELMTKAEVVYKFRDRPSHVILEVERMNVWGCDDSFLV